jgi:predicted HicB family RNase H-like nuclease
MNYKGYEASIHFSENDKIFFGEVINSSAIIGFHADTVDGLESEFHISIDDYIKMCADAGRDPKKPFSGKLLVRTTPRIHHMAKAQAKTQGISINKFVERAIVEYASH